MARLGSAVVCLVFSGCTFEAPTVQFKSAPDAAQTDGSGNPDALVDVGTDAATSDTGRDAGFGDTGADATVYDSGVVPDTGIIDTGIIDTGIIDTGVIDAGQTLAIAPQSPSVNLNSWLTFSASGGQPPYLFSIRSGGGTIDLNTGEFFSPPHPVVTTVGVEDAQGETATTDATVGGSHVWFMGGASGSSSGGYVEVRSSPDLTNWSTTTNLSGSVYLHGAVVFDDRLWIAGGRNNEDVHSAVHSSVDGATWNLEGNMPRRLRGHSMVVFSERLVVLGGRDGNDVEREEVLWSSDGSNWSDAGTLPSHRSYGSATVFDGKLWYVGGDDRFGSPTNTVFVSPDGASWQTLGPFPRYRSHGALTVHDGALWFAGGSYNGNDSSSSAWYSNGTSWTEATSLPEQRSGLGLISWNDHLWALGGSSSVGGGSSSTIYRYSSNGWSAVGGLPISTFWFAPVQFTP